MKVKFYYTLILLLIFNQLCFSQKENYVHYSNIDGNYYDDDKNRIIPKYNIKVDPDKKIYYKDSLVFIPKDEFRYSTYYFFNTRYLIITGLSKEQYRNNINYLLPKNNIIIIDTKYWDKLHYFKLNNLNIIDIYSFERSKIQINAVEILDIKVFRSDGSSVVDKAID